MASCLICLMVSVCAGAADLEPGEHKNLQTDGLVATAYDLFLPKAFATDPKARFPLVLLASSNANPGFCGLTAWAERHDVVLVSFHANPPNMLASQFAALLTTMQSYRIEPILRFLYDKHSHATHALRMKKETDWGGIIHEGTGVEVLGETIVSDSAGVTTRLKAVPHVAYGWIAGARRGTFPGRNENIENFASISYFRRQDLASSLKRKVPLVSRFSEIPHFDDTTWEVNQDLLPLVDWMVQYQRLLHPRLPPAVLKSGQDRLRKRIVDLLASTDPARSTEADTLLSIDLIAKSRDGAALAAMWCSASFAQAMTEPDAMRRCRKLDAIASNERVKAMAPAERKKLLAALAELRKDKAIRADGESRAALVIAQDADLNKSSGLDADEARRKVIVIFEEIGKRWPGTEAAEIAAFDIARLEKDLR